VLICCAVTRCLAGSDGCDLHVFTGGRFLGQIPCGLCSQSSDVLAGPDRCVSCFALLATTIDSALPIFAVTVPVPLNERFELYGILGAVIAAAVMLLLVGCVADACGRRRFLAALLFDEEIAYARL
jgi:hypothetical protein